jgi:signal peptidase II
VDIQPEIEQGKPRQQPDTRAMKFLPIIIVTVWVGLDQALKAWTVANIPCCHQWDQAVQVMPGFLSLVHATNLGAAWSLFSSATPVLIGLRLIAGIGILIWLMRTQKISRPQQIAFSLIAAGALGNSIDGLTRGFVIDMLWSHWLSAIYSPIFRGEFPIFNIADIGVIGGTILLLVSSSLNPQKAKAPTTTPNL